MVEVEEKDRPWRRRQLDEALDAILDFAHELREQGERYELRAAREKSRTRRLTLAASIVATIAGAGSLSQIAAPKVAGAIALGSAVLGTVATFVSTDAAKVDAFVKRAEMYRELESDVRSWVRVDALNPRNKLDAVGMLRDFRDRRSEVDSGLPLRRRQNATSSGDSYRQVDLSWVIQDPPP